LQAEGEVMAVGCCVELAQYYLYSHRQLFEWWDVRDDAIGIAVAFLFLQMAKRIDRAIASRS
jgi:hypothetical protein